MNISLHVHDPRATPHGRGGTYGTCLPSTCCLATVRLLRLCGRCRLISCEQHLCQLLHVCTRPPPRLYTHTHGRCYYLISLQENIVPCCCDSPLPDACWACNITTTNLTSDPHCAGYTAGRGIRLATILLTAHCLNGTSSESNNVETEKGDNRRVWHSGMRHGAVW
jgi:hypothetical protein